MKFQKDNTANRLTGDIIAEMNRKEKEKQKVVELHKKQMLDERKKVAEERKKELEAQLPLQNRIKSYPTIHDQLDMLWHDMNTGIIAVDKESANTWFQTIKSVKENNPLPSG